MTTKKILNQDFVLSFFAQFTFSSVFSLLIPTIPIYLSRMGAKEAEIGVLVGSLSVSSLVLRPLIGRALLKIPERRFMIAGALFYALSSISYLFAPPFWPLLAVRVFQGIGLAFFSTASFSTTWNQEASFQHCRSPRATLSSEIAPCQKSTNAVVPRHGTSEPPPLE